MSRVEAMADLRRSVARLTLLEKSLNSRKPLLDKHDRDLAAKKQEALRKAEESHKKKTNKIREESKKLQDEINMLRKRLVELATTAGNPDAVLASRLAS